MIDLSTYRLNPLRKDDELVLYRGVHDAMGRSAGGSRPAPESHRPRARRYKSEPLDRLLDEPLEVGAFLPLAVGIARAGERHDAGLIHKDVKPRNVLVAPGGAVRLTGFGIASPLVRERRVPEPPEFIAGTLAYMAPEQTAE